MGTVLVGMARLWLCWWPPEEDISRSYCPGWASGWEAGKSRSCGRETWVAGRTKTKMGAGERGGSGAQGRRRGGGGGFLRGRAGVEATASPAPGHFSFRHRLHRHLLPRPPPAAGNEGLGRRRKAGKAEPGGGDAAETPTRLPADWARGRFPAGPKRNVFGSE